MNSNKNTARVAVWVVSIKLNDNVTFIYMEKDIISTNESLSEAD